MILSSQLSSFLKTFTFRCGCLSEQLTGEAHSRGSPRKDDDADRHDDEEGDDDSGDQASVDAFKRYQRSQIRKYTGPWLEKQAKKTSMPRSSRLPAELKLVPTTDIGELVRLEVISIDYRCEEGRFSGVRESRHNLK